MRTKLLPDVAASARCGRRSSRMLGYLLLAGCALCGSAGSPEQSEVLLAMVVILLSAKLGGDLAQRCGQPEVLGELCAGLLIGNLGIFGTHSLEFVRNNEYLAVLSELGVILLLFQVGLETSVSEMRKVGASACLVAALGVVAPFLLGWACSSYFAPESSELVHIFVGATLTATSVGITARVLRDLHQVKTPEGKIILGAAVIDDVLGLLVLAIVTGLIASANAGSEMHIFAIGKIVFVAVGFLAAAVICGILLAPYVMAAAARLKSADVLLTFSLSICFGLAFLAQKAGLASIVGAFTAGLILEPVHFKKFERSEGYRDIDDLVAPIASLLLPVFFVRMGASVDLAALANLHLIGYALVLTVAAVAGKQICSLGVLERNTDKLAVGLGMIPRGEVGLIFAAVGARMMLNGQPVIDSGTFGAIVIMVMLTTMITPPLIKWRFGPGESAAQS